MDDLKEKTVLVIDDDTNLCQMIKFTLMMRGAEVHTAYDGTDGLRLFYAQRPDLVILDVMMPDIDGWEVCKRIRVMASTPIIMLTVLNKDDEIVRGLDSGADDFMSKPFSAEVLLARTRALLRRVEQFSVAASTPTIFQDNYLTIDMDNRQVRVKGELIKLTPTEFRLLSYLVHNARQILSHQQILENVWGWEYQGDTDYVHVYLSHLRRKIEEDPKEPKYLLTIHGVGYRFEMPG